MVKACAETVPVVILTVSEAERDLLDTVAAGAMGYLLKSSDPDELRTALLEGGAGRAGLLALLAGLVLREFRRMTERSGPDRGAVSEREREVTQHVARGHTYKEIGEELHISPKTVENHVRNILGKLRLNRRQELIRYAVDHGLD